MGARFTDLTDVISKTKDAIMSARGDPFIIGEILGMTKEGAMNRIKKLDLMAEVFMARAQAERDDPDYRRPGHDFSKPLWHMGEEGLE